MATRAGKNIINTGMDNSFMGKRNMDNLGVKTKTVKQG